MFTFNYKSVQNCNLALGTADHGVMNKTSISNLTKRSEVHTVVLCAGARLLTLCSPVRSVTVRLNEIVYVEAGPEMKV